MFITEKEIEEFELGLREKSAATAEKYLRDAKAFAKFCGGEITPESVSEFKRQLCEKYKPRSVNSFIAAVNCFLEFCGLLNLKMKSVKVQREVFCSEKKELSRPEYERLCKAARKKNNERLELVLQTVCATGIRVSELKFITVEAVKSGDITVSLKGKTRTVFIVDDLKKKLLLYCKKHGIESGQVFVTKTGKPLNRTNIWREMKNLCRMARVNPDKVFPHNLRHLFARIFYEIDKDLAKLADVLGHSNIETTRIYIISTGTEHRRRMEKMKLII